MAFWLLYGLWFGLGVGFVELAKLQWAATDIEPEPQEQRIIAVPPKPKGAKQSETEGDGEAFQYSEALCQSQPPNFIDICYHQLARQRAEHDLSGGLSSCEQIGKVDSRWECMADVAELYSSTDRDAALAVCPSIGRKKWRDQCVFGIALTYSITDSRWAFKLCSESGQWRDFCRHDVNGEIAVVNPELALEHCAAEEGDLLMRKSCWHGIGKYIARVDVQKAYAACDQVPPGPSNLYRENCIHGLGWGASESRGRDFIAGCEQSGAERDSCLLGIAYNLRRVDVDQGLQVCELVQRADLSKQCYTFVRDGVLR